jgi:hypothetical protein
MRNREIQLLLSATLAATVFTFVLQDVVHAAPFAPGDLVVYRVGDGSTALVNTGNPVFIDEYSPAGSLVQSLPMPTAANGAQNAFFASGSASSEGALTVSPNGKFIALTGYAGMSVSPTSLASSSLPRVVGIVNTTSGAIDTSTAPTDFAVGNNPRSAVTTDGVNIWMAGAAGGVRYSTIGNTGSSVMVSASPGASNFRQVNIFGGQLYVDGSSGGATFGAIGTGVPTAANQPMNLLSGFPQGLSDTIHQNPFSYFFADLSTTVPGVDTLYVADDTTHPSPTPAGGIAKYSLVGGSWVQTGSIDETSSNYRGLTGIVQNNGNVTLYATRGTANNNGSGQFIVSLTDSSGYNGNLTGTPTVIAAASSNEAFRGIGALSVTGLLGDVNLDGHVNAADISAMQNALAGLNNFKTSHSLNNYGLNSIADLNGDGQVTNADLQMLLNTLKAGGGNTTAVPEPASVSLAVLAVAGFCVVAGRNRRIS